MHIGRISPYLRVMHQHDTGTGSDDGSEKSGQDGQQSEKAAKQYSGDEVSRILKDRLAREKVKFEKERHTIREEGISEWMAEKGIDDDLLERIANDDKTKSEIRQLTTQQKKLASDNEKLRERLSHVMGMLSQDRVNSRILAAAPKDVDMKLASLVLRDRIRLNTDTFDVEFLDPNGDPDPDLTIEKMFEGVLREHPSLKLPVGGRGSGSQPQGSAQGGGNSGTPDLLTRAGRAAFLKGKLGG